MILDIFSEICWKSPLSNFLSSNVIWVTVLEGELGPHGKLGPHNTWLNEMGFFLLKVIALIHQQLTEIYIISVSC